MRKNVDRSKKPRGTLTSEKIVEVAMKMIDEQGIEAFSMRKLATELKVDPMAIYYYFKNKQTLIKQLVKQALDFTQLESIDWHRGETIDWKQGVKAFARYYIGLCRAHPNLIQHLVTNPESGYQTIQEGNEILFSALLAGGLPAHEVIRVSDILIDYLNGYSLAESTGRLPTNKERIQSFENMLDELSPEQFPATFKVIQQIDGPVETDFEVGLDLILAGISSCKTSIN